DRHARTGSAAMTHAQRAAGSTDAQSPAIAAGQAPPGERRESGWAPLRAPGFRRLWTAQFVSNIGSWMQTVAAQWVMTSLTTSALLLSAISAAGSIHALL